MKKLIAAFVTGLGLAIALSLSATQQVINVATPNSGAGDPAYTAFSKINANFTELYSTSGQFLSPTSGNQIFASPVGATGVPAFRSIAATDLPAIIPPSGTSFTAVGCLNSTLVGGASTNTLVGAGTFKVGVTGLCVLTLNLPSATHGWNCGASDSTSPVQFVQTGSSTSSCTVQANVVNNDTVAFTAIGY